MLTTVLTDRIIVKITVNYFDCQLFLNTCEFTDYSRIISLCGRHFRCFKIINYGLATMLASSHIMIFHYSLFVHGTDSQSFTNQKISAPTTRHYQIPTALSSTATFLLTFTIFLFYTHCFAIY